MKRAIKKVVERSGYTIQKTKRDTIYDKIFRDFKNFTMISQKLYVENLHVARTFAADVDGDIVECGVWRGGMSAGLAKILGTGRKYYLFDSFEGLPEAKEIDGAEALTWQKNVGGDTYFNNCKAEIDFAEKVMKGTKVDFELKIGWFSESLPEFKSENEIALLRLDGDWYDSTMDCLKYLFPKVAKKGVIIVDDYFTWDGCSKAIHDYLSIIKSSSKIYTSPGGVCYIIKHD